MSLEEILHAVAAKHRLKPIDLQSDSRTKLTSQARHEFFFRALNETSCSSPIIARFCRKDHSSVLYGAAKYAHENGLPIPRGGVCSRFEAVA